MKVHDLLLEAIESWTAGKGLAGPWRVPSAGPPRRRRGGCAFDFDAGQGRGLPGPDGRPNLRYCVTAAVCQRRGQGGARARC